MNAYEKSVSLGLTGTDAEQVAILQTLGARDILTSDVAVFLREQGLWIQGPDGPLGALATVYQQTMDTDIKTGLTEFYASLFTGQAQHILFTRPDIAGRVARIAGLLSALLGDKIVADFYALCGGRPYAELTVEEFAAQREAAGTQALRKKANSEIVERANAAVSAAAFALDGDATAEEIIAAGFAAWENWIAPEPEAK